MNSIFRSLAGVVSLIVAATATPVWAGPNDYAFEPVSVDIRNGDASELAVRLIHKPTGKPVAGATLVRTRLDMSPDNMASMTTNHTALPSTEPGVYKFRADLTMEGGWALTVAAKVPGETETVQGTVVFKVK
jgi:hypothetical protein